MSTAQELISKLTRPEGLCTSIASMDHENALRIKAIINAYLSEKCYLQRAHRSSDDWEDVLGMPHDFSEFRYRVAQ